jgi:hypothetical protein
MPGIRDSFSTLGDLLHRSGIAFVEALQFTGDIVAKALGLAHDAS